MLLTIIFRFCVGDLLFDEKNRLSFFGSVVVDVATDVLKVNGSLGLTRGNNRCFMQKSLHKESLQRLEKETLYAHI